MPLYGHLIPAEKRAMEYASLMLTFQGSHSVDTILDIIKDIENLDISSGCSSPQRQEVLKTFKIKCINEFSKSSPARNFEISDAFDTLVFQLRETRMIKREPKH